MPERERFFSRWCLPWGSELVSESVSEWQALPMIGHGSDKNQFSSSKGHLLLAIEQVQCCSSSILFVTFLVQPVCVDIVLQWMVPWDIMNSTEMFSDNANYPIVQQSNCLPSCTRTCWSLARRLGWTLLVGRTGDRLVVTFLDNYILCLGNV